MGRERSSVRNSILVKRGYKAETGVVNSDRRNRYLFNARREEERWEGRRLEGRREKENFSTGLCTSARSTQCEEKGETER